MSDITCYACEKEAVVLYSKGTSDKPVCREHAEQLKEIGAW